MIPLKLTLKNFLSYRDAVLDFCGFHTACICGANGAGKSSLLEAITWVIWGKNRTVTEDDIIHGGEMDVRVDFEFKSNQQVYKIIRMRSRGKAGSLQFQVRSESGDFISLTSKGKRDTQEYIVQELKLDYDTFINSAYLRQGRADEFMLAKPAKRKEILTGLLKLDQYEKLSQQSREKAKEYKVKAELLDQTLAPQLAKLTEREQLLAELEVADQTIVELNQQQDQDRHHLTELQQVAHQRQAWEQQLTLQQQNLQRRQEEGDRLQRDLQRVQQDLMKIKECLAQADDIEAQYQSLLQLRSQEAHFAQKFQQYQELQQQQQDCDRQLQQQEGTLQLQIRQVQTQLETLEQQEQELVQTLSEAPKISSALTTLHRVREELNRLDSLHNQISPLLQQRQNIENQILQVQEKLKLRLESIQGDRQKFAEQVAQIPGQRQQLKTLNQQLVELDKQKIYQTRVQDKRSDQSRLRERLQESQRNCHKLLSELQQKLTMLQTPDASCPLCEQDLDHDHRERVIAKTQQQQTDTEAEIWRLKEQLLQCEQELKKLEAELDQIHTHLAEYSISEQKFFKLEAELDRSTELQKTLQNLESEVETLERSLVAEDYAKDLRRDLEQVQARLQTLNYDERNHVITREEEKKWRWAEIKQNSLNEAQKRLDKLQHHKPELHSQLQERQTELSQLHQNSPLQQQRQQIHTQLQTLGYDRNEHQNLMQTLHTAQTWQLRHQELQQAIAQQPQLETRLTELEQAQALCQEDIAQATVQIADIQENIAQFADHRDEIQRLDHQIQARRQHLDRSIAHQGQLQQSLQNLAMLEEECKVSQAQLADFRRQYRIYQELSIAFGKNGIQTLMIENVLPQLEAETNHILARLTGNQFHVQFLTQKAKKGSKKQASQLIDTLDILIADARGTRAYETYSGGEAFRINFAIRLALAKLLAQRSGMALQMLIIDEGFGTQDAEGCARLIAAINAIANDFACILAVTHIPQFKEAFQSRIEVYKTKQGSQLQVNN